MVGCFDPPVAYNWSVMMAWRISPLLWWWISSKKSGLHRYFSCFAIAVKIFFILGLVTEWICIRVVWSLSYKISGGMRRSKSSGRCFPSETSLNMSIVGTRERCKWLVMMSRNLCCADGPCKFGNSSSRMIALLSVLTLSPDDDRSKDEMPEPLCCKNSWKEFSADVCSTEKSPLECMSCEDRDRKDSFHDKIDALNSLAMIRIAVLFPIPGLPTKTNSFCWFWESEFDEREFWTHDLISLTFLGATLRSALDLGANFSTHMMVSLEDFCVRPSDDRARFLPVVVESIFWSHQIFFCFLLASFVASPLALETLPCERVVGHESRCGGRRFLRDEGWLILIAGPFEMENGFVPFVDLLSGP